MTQTPKLSRKMNSFPILDLDALRRISRNTQEDWHQQHHRTIKHNLIETTSCTIFWASHAMIAYFTDRPPYLQDFRDWVKEIFHQKNGWRIHHTLYVGRNFFSIEFDEAADRDAALSYAPWFFGRKYFYTFPWIPDFDVTTGHYNMLPVWIEIPFRSLILESARYKLASSLGQVLLYIWGKGEPHIQTIKPALCGILQSAFPKASESGYLKPLIFGNR